MSYRNEGRRPWKEIAMDMLGETERGRFLELAEELEDAVTAQVFGNKCPGHLAEQNPGRLLITSQSIECEKLIGAAVRIMRSDYASIQMLYPERGEGGELRLLSFRGFNPGAARFWEWVRADSKSTCGIALREAERVVAADITTCDLMADSEDQQVYLETGIHACQTTPLIGRAGNVVGMISTHWRTPHQPSKDDFRQLDILAKQASDLVESCRRGQALLHDGEHRILS